MEEKPMSVLEGDEKFLKKILSRDSSVGHHLNVSRDYRSVGEVPFQWEMMPGTPRNPSSGESSIRAGFNEEYQEEEETDIRAVRPPLVVGSVGRPKLRVPSKKVDYLALSKSRFWRKNFWKRSKKFHQENDSGFDDNESSKFSNCDDGHKYKPLASKISSSSPSSSSSSSYSSSFLPLADDHRGMCTHHHRTSKAWLERFASWAFS